MGSGSDARKKTPKSSGAKRAGVPKTDKVPPPVPFANPYAKGQKPPKPPPPPGASKTDILPTAKAEKLGGALPFLPPPVKPEAAAGGAEKTAEFAIPSAAFFVDTRSELERAGPLPPPPGAPKDATPPPFPQITTRVAGEDTKRYRKRVKEHTDRMRRNPDEARPAVRLEDVAALPDQPVEPPPPLSEGPPPPAWEDPFKPGK
jgi:hypothetical protein